MVTHRSVDAPHRLRALAQGRALHESEPSPLGLTDHELRSLVQELPVHKIELQMQNEDLLNAQEDLLQAAAVFTHGYDGIVVCNDEGVIVDTYPAFTRFTGYEKAEAIGHAVHRRGA